MAAVPGRGRVVQTRSPVVSTRDNRRDLEPAGTLSPAGRRVKRCWPRG